MTIHDNRVVTVRLDKHKLYQTITVLPVLIIVMFAIVDTVVMNITPATVDSPALPVAENAPAPVETVQTYPATGAELNVSLFSRQLPPPSLDALPYDVREPLSNGASVPVKKRWLWLPPGQQMVVSRGDDGALDVDVPDGALWWKEFYVETDRGAFLIERRIIARVPPTAANPDGWAYYSSHYLSPGMGDEMVVLASDSEEAGRYLFEPGEWLPTQHETAHREVRFEDTRGVQYPYLFPGQIQCVACHKGAAGAYPNADDNPIAVFGLHPNNLSPASFVALVERGWITNGELLLSQPASDAAVDVVPFDALTDQLVAFMRNNCASCHNASPYAFANYTAFIIDPNQAYTSDELLQLLSADGLMMPDAKPLVTPGVLNESEIWLRINGHENRRRMPPLEGGLPEIDHSMVSLFESWIVESGRQ